MGRYTTVQTYTDKDAKVAAIAYTAATKGDAASIAAAAPEVPLGDSAASQQSGGDKSGEKGGDDRFSTVRVENVSGSSAGAGSGDFHMYRAARRRELDRVERMEKDYKKRKEQEEFEATRKRNLSEFEARAAKRAEKRRKRKDRAKARTLDQALSGGESDNEDAVEAKKASEETKEAAVLPETPGGVPEIANDGSFLERMLALQKQQQQEQGKESATKKA